MNATEIRSKLFDDNEGRKSWDGPLVTQTINLTLEEAAKELEGCANVHCGCCRTAADRVRNLKS